MKLIFHNFLICLACLWYSFASHIGDVHQYLTKVLWSYYHIYILLARWAFPNLRENQGPFG